MTAEETRKIVIAGSPQAVLGFRLAGITEPCANPDEVEGLLARGDISLIIMTSGMRGRLSDRVRKMVDASTRPLCIEVPDMAGGAREVSLRERIKRAIGLDLGK